ncbi:MAG: UDP-2,3-diacylglucosamine diphosphatase LpxI [Verrucomicrobiae bacterium]|nr:UDP-2,3-diacylglucosamine diphosphatase LpxI [Verrucomicrobiae bacterium]
MERIGIIAGSGSYPLLLAASARQHGVRQVVAVAFEGETSPQIARAADHVEWVKLGQLNRLIHALTDRGVTEAIMAGQVAPKNLFRDLRPDLRLVTLMARLKEKNAETIFGAVADELKKDGVTLLPATTFMEDYLAPAGPIGKRKPSAEQQKDIAFGLKLAKGVSAFDIGQTVVVKNGTVLAVEALEGTDECIRRGGALAGEQGGAVVVKVTKPNQDMRFDVPVIGPRTIESCAAGRVAVLAVDAGRTLLLDNEATLAAAERARLAVCGAAL